MEKCDYVEVLHGDIPAARKKGNNIKHVSDVTAPEKGPGFVSMFRHTEDLKKYVEEHKVTKGFHGPHICDEIIVDIDYAADPEIAWQDADKYVKRLLNEYGVPRDLIKICFTGGRGYHISVPIGAFTGNPEPSESFNVLIHRIATELTKGIDHVDLGIYNEDRPIRMENTLHEFIEKEKLQYGGLYKVRLTLKEFSEKDNIFQLAKSPRKWPTTCGSNTVVVRSLKDVYDSCSAAGYVKASAPTATRIEPSTAMSLFEPVAEGQRNNHAVKLTKYLGGHGVDKQTTLAMLQLWNRQNVPPLPNDELEGIVSRIHSEKSPSDVKLLGIEDLLQAYETYKNGAAERGLNTGFDPIDVKTRGLWPGDVVTVLGRTGVGKSAFAQFVAQSCAKRSLNTAVIFFSLEMPDGMVAERMLQIETNQRASELQKNFLARAIPSEIETKLKKDLANFYVVDTGGLSLAEIERIVLGARESTGKDIGLIVLDYLSLIKASGNNSYEHATSISRELKAMAKRLSVVLMVIVQVSRKLKDVDEVEIDSARDSGAIEEASDIVLGLNLMKDANSPDDQESERVLSLRLLKNRRGGKKKVTIVMDRESMTFKLLSEESNASDNQPAATRKRKSAGDRKSKPRKERVEARESELLTEGLDSELEEKFYGKS